MLLMHHPTEDRGATTAEALLRGMAMVATTHHLQRLDPTATRHLAAIQRLDIHPQQQVILQDMVVMPMMAREEHLHPSSLLAMGVAMTCMVPVTHPVMVAVSAASMARVETTVGTTGSLARAGSEVATAAAGGTTETTTEEGTSSPEVVEEKERAASKLMVGPSETMGFLLQHLATFAGWHHEVTLVRQFRDPI